MFPYSDVWSMGVVLFVLTQNRLPFGERDTKKLLASQLEKNFKFVKTVSKQLKDLVNEHLNPDPNSRPNMEQVLAHQWFEQEDGEE